MKSWAERVSVEKKKSTASVGDGDWRLDQNTKERQELMLEDKG